jgi:hypothetical protein
MNYLYDNKILKKKKGGRLEDRATTVNTYTMPAEGPYEPVLFSSSQAEVKNIIELTF